uniref:MULE transposase domain-containing protein n=1 Tax=Romanomermis culicivorax TaxID=13658 RepID=A0A915L3H9_ROMCU
MLLEATDKEKSVTLKVEEVKQQRSVPLCFALLSSKQRGTYEQLFHCLINNLTVRFNDIGILHTILMDFESAAMQACRHLLPANINIRGSLFHFGQCLMRWLQSNGLKAAYEEENGQLRHWILLIKACSMLPPNLVRNAWLQWLCNPPAYEDQIIRQKLANFVTYFEHFGEQKSDNFFGATRQNKKVRLTLCNLRIAAFSLVGKNFTNHNNVILNAMRMLPVNGRRHKYEIWPEQLFHQRQWNSRGFVNNEKLSLPQFGCVRWMNILKNAMAPAIANPNAADLPRPRAAVNETVALRVFSLSIQ